MLEWVRGVCFLFFLLRLLPLALLVMFNYDVFLWFVIFSMVHCGF